MALPFEIMATVQVKHVPDDVHRVLRRRAAEAGQSLQEHTLALLVEYARAPTMREIFERARQQSGGGLTLEFAVAAQRADRDSR
jgi:plasmid stability protein